jgi:hypothetical protein
VAGHRAACAGCRARGRGRSPLTVVLSVARGQQWVPEERTFLVDAVDPDNPTVSFSAFDASGRPGVLYLMLWGLPRLDE